MANPLSAPPILPPAKGGGGKSPSLKGLKGSSAPAPKPFTIPKSQVAAKTTSPGRQLIGNINREQRQSRLLERQPSPQMPKFGNLRQGERQARVQQIKAERAQIPKSSGGGGGLTLATISGLPSRVIAQGYKNLASATGVNALKYLGKIPAEAVNIPTQVLPAAYYTGKALGAARAGKPQELHELAKNFAKESPVAHLVKGDFSGAAKAAGEHPLSTALEAGGAASVADRAAGFAKAALGGMGSASDTEVARALEAGAPVSRQPREFPPGAVPPAKEGGATVPQRPYHRGVVRPALEKALERPVPQGRIASNLRRLFDRFEGETLRVTRMDRDRVRHQRAQAVRGVDNQGAIVPFGQWLADPKAINPETGQSFAQEHLQEMIDHLERKPGGEHKGEAEIREANVRHLKALQGKDLSEPYDAALKVAQDKADLEPELIKHGLLSEDTARIAKLIPAFQFHFRGENPFVDTTAREGTPFRLGGPEGTPISVDDVAKRLEEKGVHEHQLSFVSTRPFQSGSRPFRSGRMPGGAKEARGHLTGHAFLRGQVDPTYDAAIRQHLTDVQRINSARSDLRMGKEYVHTRQQLAKLLEARLDRLPPDQQASMRKYIDTELRSGSALHFEPKGGKGQGQRALEAQARMQELYPEMQLEPMRVGHPFATKEYRRALGGHMDNLGETLDKFDPSTYSPDQRGFWSHAPQEPNALNDVTAGPVGLAHHEIVQRVRRYEKDLGQAHLARLPASFWRKVNVAYSVRHVPGVMGEVGIRALANKIGPLSYMRGTRAMQEIIRLGEESPRPEDKLAAQRWRAVEQGTVSSQALEATRHTTPGQLADTALGKPADWWNKGEARRITGAPLRAVRGAVKAFNAGTNGILALERNYIEHPPQVAGAGKHLANEFKAISGKRLKLIGSFRDVEKAFAKGMLDPKAIDHYASMSREYFGDWMRTSPEFKKIQSVSPFAQWYLNSLHFIYHTMPLHHPAKSGLIAAMETATREKRLAEGQEYKGGFHLLSTDLEPSQQGSLPLGGKERLGQEYYTPQGAVSAGPVETTLGAILPYASSIYLTARGINPVTNKPLEEKNSETGKKEPIRDQGKLALLGALALGESMLPPLRYQQALQRKPPSYVFRPFRTEKTRREVPEKKAKGVKLGPSLGGGGLGSKLGSSLK